MDVLHELKQRGAILRGRHFVYKSTKHGADYINMDPAFPDVAFMTKVCAGLAEPFWGSQVEAVVGAATGGIPLAALTAASTVPGPRMNRFAPAFAWADKVGAKKDDFAFERVGFAQQLAGKRVLVVEDILNTGGTVSKVVAELRKHGCTVVGISAVCNRGTQTAESLDVPRLEQLSIVTDFSAPFEADACTLCAEGVPIVENIGHGDEFKEEHPAYAGGYVELFGA